jgi:hypothetical protein
MKLKIVRILSILPIVLALLTAGCDANKWSNVNPALGVLTLVFVIVTAISSDPKNTSFLAKFGGFNSHTPLLY